ncbi:penicillin-binding protein PBP2A [Streptococcus suis]|uniref:penicillin-binding protein PBP2A n=1 Tax=Streptococcus suis TaxID=1307 RepID=UPI00209AD7AD|nr:penicillin-binding protein PBP2A [Streptococcus suis]MCO8189235.1 penicillin-binding protein PBP2A [Streptococcus suis]MCO8213503.1 penicillin-binding protein PBP2A [Streptococcus suis]MCO8232912.1 penicillin-binding protein PBP2A [Streptococcus suis]MCO8239210.1 penicillin-binding protein PBP2A [Streptococcus suis]HEM3438531.1 penicillin-binding protein [Streptococcus suis]
MDDLQHQPIEVPEDFQIDHEDRPSRHRRGNRGSIDKPKKKSRIPEPIRKFWRRYQLTKILIILMVLTVLTVGGYLFFLAKTANVGDLQQALKATTIIYDKDGAEAGTLSGQKGTYVELDAVSDNLENAVIATEDRSFYKNSGINYQRTILAALTLGRSGGGSTITQQLAKNAFLTQDQTISRKAREFFLALEINKKYSKQEILTMYLNNAYFGNGVWGVEDASQKYFGIPASDLTLEQAAVIAGMLKGPEIYNPYYSLENAVNRRDTVLQNMVNAGYIDQATADAGFQVDLASQLSDTYSGKQDNYSYPSYFDAVIAEAIERYGLKESDIINNGYRIYTEMDQNSQASMQVIFNDETMFPTSSFDGTHAQAASVALDPTTGGVRALVGRVNSSEDAVFRTFNFATQAKRSPGSTIKPLVAYAPAVAAGWSIDMALDNHTETYGDYTLHNYDYSTSDTIPMYQALALSYNLPVAHIVNTLGIDKAFEYGQKFGLDMENVEKVLGVSIGSGVETNPLQMAQAYATFANKGVMKDAHLITRIETASGKVLAEHRETSTKVIDRSVADKMTAMMLGTYTNGTGVTADAANYYIAGKTGTTETSFDVNLVNDQWHIAYTPDLVISQWVGFEQTDENHYIDSSSYWMAPSVFQTVANSILPYTAGTQFEVENAYAQNGIVEVAPDEAAQTESSLGQEQVQEISDQAKNLIEQTKQNLIDAQLPERAKTLWDNITSWFGELSNP